MHRKSFFLLFYCNCNYVCSNTLRMQKCVRRRASGLWAPAGTGLGDTGITLEYRRGLKTPPLVFRISICGFLTYSGLILSGAPRSTGDWVSQGCAGSCWGRLSASWLILIFCANLQRPLCTLVFALENSCSFILCACSGHCAILSAVDRTENKPSPA
jgi:hypothetical protein